MRQRIFAAVMQTMFRLAVTVELADDALSQIQLSIPGEANPANLDVDFHIHKAVDKGGLLSRAVIVIVVKAHSLQVPCGLVFLPRTIIQADHDLRQPQLFSVCKKLEQHGLFAAQPHVFSLPRAFSEEIRGRFRVWFSRNLAIEVAQRLLLLHTSMASTRLIKCRICGW